jgi:hypothetical protein
MTTNLDDLRLKRRKWVEANRENGFEDGIKRLLTDLYPDNAHFIYELLQNAEDPHATTVRFTLTNSAVEFEHDGERLFSLKDVESITSIGTSTKHDDPTSIGKFGVGFKAVFAYTNTPEIHSGDFHFRIHDLVVPETDRVPHPKMGTRKTSFRFPFNNPRKPEKQAVEEVERGLRALGDNTLLFLSHISNIEYVLPNGDSGSLERIESDGGFIQIRNETSSTHWLRFQKDVVVEDENGENKTCRIAIAYRLVGRDDRRVHPLQDGQVSIFFPAEKETSNLRFHLHAPFASTVARDSVRDCKANQLLRDALAELVAESLTTIRDQGMLTVDFLAVLPNPQDNVPSFYEPIRKALVRTFKDEMLTPTKSGSHAPSKKLYRGPARISDILNDGDMSILTHRALPLWAANPSQQNQREDRFLESLGMDLWGWNELAAVFSKLDDIGRKNIEAWISKKSDAWLIRLYALLGDACVSPHNKRVSIDHLLKIIRVNINNYETHIFPSYAFFPPSDGTSPPVDTRLVKPSVYATEGTEAQKRSARLFLDQIGVRVFNSRVAIESRLRDYSLKSMSVGPDYFKDIKQFVLFWKTNPNESSIFKSGRFLLDDQQNWCMAMQLFLDAPYLDTGLSELSTIHKKKSVWHGYIDNLSESQLKDFVGFMKAIGVKTGLDVVKASIHTNPNRGKLWEGTYGTRKSQYEISSDFSIYELEAYLNMHSVNCARLIWLALIEADSSAAVAQYRPNSSYATRETDSQLIWHLKNNAWIPNRQGEFCKAQEISKDDLYPGFVYDDSNGLLTAIRFGESARKRSEEYVTLDNVARSIGFSSAEVAEEVARLIKEAGLTLEELRSFSAKHQRIELPDQAVPNPERRRKHVLENTADAPSKESVLRERTIQKGVTEVTAQAKAYLRAKYKNAAGQLVCQCCHEEMPFKLQSGEHYFEAKQCIGDKESRYYQNRLALCPTCAAMYQHARETDDTEIRRRIVEHSASDQVPSVEIPIRVADREHTLHFVGTHWFDLKTVLSDQESVP